VIDKHGYIYIKCRVDNLVKVGGFRVSLDEISHAIKKIPGIKECITVKADDELFGASIIAAVTLNKKMTPEELHAEARKILASYKVPKKFIILKKMPLTDSGKIAKKEIEEKIKNAERHKQSTKGHTL